MGIYNFHKNYYFLALEYPVKIDVDGIIYENAKRAYAAIRFIDKRYRERCQTCSDKELDYIINNMISGPLIKQSFTDDPIIDLEAILRIKFSNEGLAKLLLETGDELIINLKKGQKLMGAYKGVGENLLGIALTNVREELRERKN